MLHRLRSERCARLARLSLPPELERSAPRDVGLTAGGLTLILLAWLLAAGALAAGVALYLEAQRQADAASDFDRRGVTANAVVDRLWRKKGDGKPAFAAFHFDADGARIDGESRMQLSAWRELRAGSTVPVRYLPDNPRRFVVAGRAAGPAAVRRGVRRVVRAGGARPSLLRGGSLAAHPAQ